MADKRSQKTAGSKARIDVELILAEMGVKPIKINFIPRRGKERYISTSLLNHYQVMKLWEKKLTFLKKKDVLFIQFPFIQHSVFLSSVLKKIKKKGVKIIAIIHDLESVRIVKREDISLLKRCIIKIEEKFTFKRSRWIIVHNETMSKFLRKNGVASRKLVSLKIFDYLVTNFDRGKSDFAYLNKKRPIIIAGTLRVHKASYAYHLPTGMKFNLYGPGFTGENRPNIDYKGSFAPNKLPNILDGSFGLVWDGDSIESCTGIYGEYMEINNPHKASLYLSAGIPVIIWSKAALSKFILDNKCGFTVNSIFEIKSRIASMTDEEYGEFKKNAEFIGSRLRKGFYLKKILNDKNIN